MASKSLNILIRGISKPYGKKLSGAEPVKCQKCGKPIGYVTVFAKGFASFQQRLQEVKLIAICMECAQKQK